MAKKVSFESSMERLEEIVHHLEKGDLPLADSMKLFEEGTALAAGCSAMLDEAEQKVSILRKDKNGEPTEVPFEGEKT